MTPEYYDYLAIGLGLLGVILAAVALIKLAGVTKIANDIQDRMQNPDKYARRTNFDSPKGGRQYPDNASGTNQVKGSQVASLSAKVVDLEREVKKLQSALVASPTALQQNPTRAKPGEAFDPRSAPLAEASIAQAATSDTVESSESPPTAGTAQHHSPKREVIYLLYTDKPQWPAASVSAGQREMSMFRAELDSETTGTLRLIPSSDMLRNILFQPTDYPSPALQYAQQGTRGELAKETPGRIERASDGAWRVLQPVHIVIA